MTAGAETPIDPESPPSRGLFSILLVTLICGLAGGLVWIGRVRAGLIVFALWTALAALLLWRLYVGDEWTWPIGFVLARPVLYSVGCFLIAAAAVLWTRRGAIAGEWSRGRRVALLLAVFALVPLGGAAYFRSFILQSFSSPSSAMAPTLRSGDYFFAEKGAFRNGGRPEIGDIVVFTHPTNGGVYVQRLVGLPGDSMQMKGGVLHLNGMPVELANTELAYSFDGQTGLIQIETLPNGRQHQVVDLGAGGAGDDTEDFVVPDGHFFAMGDNRDNSADSRFPRYLGMVPLENLIGRAARIYWSASDPDFRQRADLNAQTGR